MRFRSAIAAAVIAATTLTAASADAAILERGSNWQTVPERGSNWQGRPASCRRVPVTVDLHGAPVYRVQCSGGMTRSCKVLVQRGMRRVECR